MKVYQHVNIVTCDQDFHVYLDGILAVKDSQIVYVGQEQSEILEQAGRFSRYSTTRENPFSTPRNYALSPRLCSQVQ